jgi:glycosyltransferase involved in cell wall biosynthesis
MNKPFFSIVIPVYNRAGTIGSVIQSCIEQTFSNFEIIVVDDGSNDNLEMAVQKIADDRIRYIYQKNAGGAAARNLGIEKSHADFIAFLDSDDTFVKDKLSIVYDVIKKHQMTSLVIFSTLYVDRGVGKYWVKPPRVLNDQERVSDYVMADRGFLQTSTLVVETKLAKKTLFQKGLPFGQDTDFAVRLERNNANFKMIDKPLVIWNDVQASDRVSNGKDYKPILEWLDSLKSFISPNAYYTYKGFHIARLARKRSIWLAYKFLFLSLLSGKMSVKVAIFSLLQVTLSRGLYRKISDLLVKFKGLKLSLIDS